MRRNKAIVTVIMISLAAVFAALCGCGAGLPAFISGEEASLDPAPAETGDDPMPAVDTETKDEGADLHEEESETDAEPSLYRAVASEEGLGSTAICGAVVNSSNYTDDRLMEVVYKNFNAVTLENELKMDCMFGYSNEHCPGGSVHEEELNGEKIDVPTLDFSRADKMLDRILELNERSEGNKLRVRGHVLVWHSQAPEWFFHEDYDASKEYVSRDILDKRLEWYIKSMLEHYTGEDSRYRELFYGWDVVNEAVSDRTGSYRTDTEQGDDSLSDPIHTIKSTWWHVYQSNEFIINAFKYANKYAPETLELYYNDYNECVGNKMEGILNLIADVKNEPGTRLDGFGMQGHYSIGSPDAYKIRDCARQYAQAAGKVMITEFDTRSKGLDGSDEMLQLEYSKQADYCMEIYDVLKELTGEGVNVAGITTWGVLDTQSWIQTYDDDGGENDGKLKHCPLLFDGNYEPKPAYWAFTDPSVLGR